MKKQKAPSITVTPRGTSTSRAPTGERLNTRASCGCPWRPCEPKKGNPAGEISNSINWVFKILVIMNEGMNEAWEESQFKQWGTMNVHRLYISVPYVNNSWSQPVCV